MVAEHENLDAEALFNKVMEQVVNDCDRYFTAEEGNGKYLDLHFSYMKFTNIKKVSVLSLCY